LGGVAERSKAPHSTINRSSKERILSEQGLALLFFCLLIEIGEKRGTPDGVCRGGGVSTVRRERSPKRPRHLINVLALLAFQDF